METILLILSSVILVSAISLVGVLTLSINPKKLHSAIMIFLAFASGTLLTTAFTHMLPEGFHELGEIAPTITLAGVLLFFFIEKFIHWHHCGKEECHVKPAAYLNLVGDAIHNLVDGIIITAAYLTNIELGLVTTAAIILHEIPQELGDFSVLLHSGMNVKNALKYNFFSATAAIFGAMISYYYLSSVEYLIPYAIAFAAGGFIYIATADLMPELHKDATPRKIVIHTIALMLGVMVIVIASWIFPDMH